MCYLISLVTRLHLLLLLLLLLLDMSCVSPLLFLSLSLPRRCRVASTIFVIFLYFSWLKAFHLELSERPLSSLLFSF